MQINKKIAYSCSLLANKIPQNKLPYCASQASDDRELGKNNSIIRLVINEKSYSRTVILSL